MKKILSLVITVLMLLTLMSASMYAEETVTINVYNWGQYIGIGEDGMIDVNEEFTKATGIEVNYVTYDSNETMYSKLDMGGTSYDIIIPSDYMIERLIAEDMLEKLDFSNIPNFKYVNENFRSPSYDPTGEYSVPYTFGAVGVIYNTKYVSEEDIGSWDLLWNEKYAGKILMFNNPRDAFGIAEFLIGESVNSNSSDVIDAAYEKLKEQSKVNKKRVMDEIFQMMQNEDAWIAPYYVGDFITMQEENEALEFYYPKEGFNYFVDAICIPKGAEHKAEAEAYINFLCSPEISGRNMEAIGYSSPIDGNLDYMDAELVETMSKYIDTSIAAHGTIFSNLSDTALQYMNKRWSDIVAGNLNATLIWVCCGVVVVAVVALIVVLGQKKKKKGNLYYDK